MLFAQVPQGFNYTAIVRNADGTAIKNKEINLEVALQNDDASEVYYTEQHKVKTNNNGVLSVVIGSGTTTDNFSAIPWEKGNIFVQLKVDDKLLMATKLQSVPYALYAQSGGGGGSTSNGDVLFAVKNKQGDTVFAVYPEGVRVYVDKNGKAQRGGFAVATRGFGKGNEPTEVFTVTPDSTRIYIKDNGKAQRGGFAIATRRFSKGTEQEKDIFTVDPNHNVKVVVDGKGKNKALRGGFAVATRGFSNKGEEETDKTIFTTTADSTRVYIDESGKAQRGGFAIAKRSLGKGKEKEIFTVEPNHNVKVVVDDKGKNKALRGGFAVATRGFSNKGEEETDKTIFATTADSTRVYLNDKTSGKAQRGGFAIATRRFGKGKIQNNFDISNSKQAEVINGENRILWYPKKNAFMAGKIVVDSVNAVGENSFASGYESKAIGDYSTAIGYKAIAKDTSSFAFGEKAQALGVKSYAIGREAKAIGRGSFAFGSGCPKGSNGTYGWNQAVAPQAIGEYSYAFGLGSVSKGRGSFAMGFCNVASGESSTAIGYFTKAMGFKSIAMGGSTVASGAYSTAMGYVTTASSHASIAMGGSTIASGWYSTAMGNKTTASGLTSTAMGNETTASGKNSTAMGSNTTASGKYSMAMGTGTKAIGYYSTAIGVGTSAIGHYSIAIGRNIKVSETGINSIGIGLGNVQKKDSITKSNTMAIMGGKVGIGTVSPDKNFVVDGDARITGNIYYGNNGSSKYDKPDFVFDRNYTKNYTIAEIEEFIEENSHLPWLTSAKEEEEQGVNLTRMSFETLEAVENQQLQIIQLKKENDKLKVQQEQQNKENEQLKAELKAQKEQNKTDIQNLQKQIEELKRMIND